MDILIGQLVDLRIPVALLLAPQTPPKVHILKALRFSSITENKDIRQRHPGQDLAVPAQHDLIQDNRTA